MSHIVLVLSCVLTCVLTGLDLDIILTILASPSMYKVIDLTKRKTSTYKQANYNRTNQQRRSNMSIENKFRSYLASMDGNEKDFTVEVSHLFEELYHQDFLLEQDGSVVSREQIMQFQSKAFMLGSEATLLHFSTHPDNSTIEFKFRLTNDRHDIVIHNVAAIKDDKIIRATPVQDTKPLLLVNFEAYVAAFDGTPKDFSSVSHLFDLVYDDEFAYKVDEKPTYYDKKLMKEIQSNFFALGSKATLLLFKDLGSDEVEFKFRMENEKVDVIVHNIATVKNNKLIKSKPIDVASCESVSKIRNASKSYESVKPEVKSVTYSGFDNAAMMSPQ